MMKFLVDADLPNSAVEPFKRRGFTAKHVRETGLGNDSDTDITEYANKEGYAVVTRDQGFRNPLLTPEVENGLVVLKLHNYAPEDLKERLDAFLRNVEIDEIDGSITAVEENRYRINRVD